MRTVVDRHRSDRRCINQQNIVVKGSQLGTFCPWAIAYCYLEFILRYLKNLKLFSIRVKELFEPIVVLPQKQNKKKKSDRFLLFLKAFSCETDF